MKATKSCWIELPSYLPWIITLFAMVVSETPTGAIIHLLKNAHKLASICEVFNQVLDLVKPDHTFVLHSDLYLHSEQSSLSGYCFTSQLSSSLGGGSTTSYPYKKWILDILYSPCFSGFFSGLVKEECLYFL